MNMHDITGGVLHFRHRPIQSNSSFVYSAGGQDWSLLTAHSFVQCHAVTGSPRVLAKSPGSQRRRARETQGVQTLHLSHV